MEVEIAKISRVRISTEYNHYLPRIKYIKINEKIVAMAKNNLIRPKFFARIFKIYMPKLELRSFGYHYIFTFKGELLREIKNKYRDQIEKCFGKNKNKHWIAETIQNFRTIDQVEIFFDDNFQTTERFDEIWQYIQCDSVHKDVVIWFLQNCSKDMLLGKLAQLSERFDNDCVGEMVLLYPHKFSLDSVIRQIFSKYDVPIFWKSILNIMIDSK